MQTKGFLLQGLKRVKMGIENMCDHYMHKVHSDLLKNRGTTTCSSNTMHVVQKKKIRNCLLCDAWVRDILQEIRKDGQGRPVHDPDRVNSWRNCDSRDWPKKHWEVAKVFMSQGYNDKHNASQTDISGLLCVVINAEVFEREGFSNCFTDAAKVNTCI